MIINQSAPRTPQAVHHSINMIFMKPVYKSAFYGGLILFQKESLFPPYQHFGNPD
jgi:hypothetical protein